MARSGIAVAVGSVVPMSDVWASGVADGVSGDGGGGVVVSGAGGAEPVEEGSDVRLGKTSLLMLVDVVEFNSARLVEVVEEGSSIAVAIVEAKVLELSLIHI